MSFPRTRRLKVPHVTEALLLRLVAYGEADAVVTLLTEQLGRVSAMARNVQRPRPTRPVVLEPIHTLRIALDESPGVEMMVLREARLERVRHRLTRRLEALDAAGQGLRWARSLAPPRAPEPALWEETTRLLDQLDDEEVLPPRPALAATGLRMLAAVGYGFELRGCVKCGKACPDEAPARFDARQGGLVCVACGGGPLLLRAELRAALLAAEAGDNAALPEIEAEAVIDWVETALATHLSVGEQKT